MQTSNIKEIRVLLSCPDEVVKEDDFLNDIEDIIQKVNILLVNNFNIRLELGHWKKNMSLGRGEPRVQDRINHRLVEHCDIFIGLLWTRFGTSPGTTLEGLCYESGTEEEFNLAQGLDKDVWIFFSDCPVPPSQINTEQLVKVRKFKKSLKSSQIQYSEFSKIKEFHEHFTANISEWIKARYSIADKEILEKKKDAPSKEDFRKFTKGF